MKELDLTKKLSDLVREYPEVKEIMSNLGFREVTNPIALGAMGKLLTIPMGAQVRGIPMEQITAAFEAAGFQIVGEEAPVEVSDFVKKAAKTFGGIDTKDAQEPNSSNPQNMAVAEKDSAADAGFQGNTPAQSGTSVAQKAEDASRYDLLKSMILRLSDGESLENVRKDFVKHFSSISVEEIAGVEQQLIEEGMAVEEVMQLCDVHSALFHGRTTDEVCATLGVGFELAPGHPVSVLKAENTGLLEILDSFESTLTEAADIEDIKSALTKLKAVKAHYGKKEELIMPLLYNYGFTGPADVMWGVDDEIYKETSSLAKEVSEETWPEILKRVQEVVARMREMVYKEEQIFLPLALEHLSQEEWYTVYRDLGEFGHAFVEDTPKWIDGDVWVGLQPGPKNDALVDGKIHFATGELSITELFKIFELLPIDLTFIDDTETTRFFTNEGHVFARPLSCLGREIWSCHPPAIIPMVKTMLEGFKNGEMDNMVMWTPSPENPVRVEYHAVRNDEGAYIGCLEMVQKFGPEDMAQFREMLDV